MSIDPRTMKQLIEIQWSNRFDLLSTNGASQTETQPFGEMLELLLGEQTASSYNRIVPAADLLMRNASLYSRPSTPTSFDPIIEQASAKYGVSSSLVKSVIHAESSFDSMSVSGAGAKGLMQLMDNTARGLGVTDSFDPEQNINGGTRYLSEMLNKYNGSEAVALAAYNAGPGRIDRLGIRTEADLQAKFSQLPQETQKYVNKVLELAKGYQV
ncbi:lytic transglycosylase domain-containing protein [Paenibacillus contaminans]|uniref:Lytic transglycosylase domain-containing protein n=1 Tax=Paenibacillus contaminans TaxID=450362 RepID=A0A329MQM8_9BACL|nr:lytic transglycosylase domain-containing protein [Paenibacillus contaminans]RAV21738.1 lytic transglycosylase domain-containing protein [Paenibacillus contaminans]